VDSDELYKGTHSQIVDTGLVGVINSKLHRDLEKGFSPSFNDSKYEILELGAGMGQHLKFVKEKYSRYVQSDIRIENLSIPQSSSIQNVQLDAEDLNMIHNNSFDRIVASCLLVHLKDPEKALLEWKRVVRKGGLISIYVPCEPGLLLRASRYLTTNLKAKRLGYDHLSLHYREHVSYFVRLNKLIQEVFCDAEVKRTFFPFNFIPSWNLNLWATYQVRLPILHD
jgi:phosphatidylethanolamine/phosphatidyl-N-methylethanolamine N-methyltransferase